MIVTIRADITWDGKNKTFANQGEKSFKRALKTFLEADDVEIISIDCWDEDEDEENPGTKSGINKAEKHNALVYEITLDELLELVE